VSLTSTQIQQLKMPLMAEQTELTRLLNMIDQSAKPVELDQNKVGVYRAWGLTDRPKTSP